MMLQSAKAEEFFKEVGTTIVLVPVPHNIWSGIFMPVDIPKLKQIIEDDNTHQYWFKIDRRDGFIYIDGMGKEPRKKKDIPPSAHY